MTKAESAASRTPRVDAAVATVTVPFEREEKILVTEAVPADFARTLELEAADLRERLAALSAPQQEPVAGRCVAPPCKCNDENRRKCAYWHEAPQPADGVVVPFNVEFAASCLDGAMAHEQAEIAGWWKTVRNYLLAAAKEPGQA